MRTKLLSVVLFVFSVSIQAEVSIQQWQTSQGVPVYYINNSALPMVDIKVIFDAGSARDLKQHGVASFTSSLLKTGAGKWSADQIAERFESVGAQFSVGASDDSASLSLRTLTEPKLFDKALATMQTVLTQPTFASADFNREQTRLLTLLKHREESPGAIASLAFYKALYGDHPYAYAGSGYIETVSKFKPSDTQAFYKSHYVTANAMVVIVGNLNKQQATYTAETLMAKLPKGQKPAPLPDVKLPEKSTTQYINYPSTQTHVLVGFPGMDRHDKDYIALYVGNHILGGSGLVSKLFKEVREKRGLAYSAYSHFSPMVKKGPFTMGLQTKNDQTQEALKVLNTTLSDFINQGITEEELIAAKKNITGGFVIRFDNNSKLMRYLGLIGFHKLPLDYLNTFPQRVEAITVADIKEAFKRRVRPELLQTVTVGGSLKETKK
ncbi:MAG: pitrilysin family protein [Methylococcales bacterium]|nr:pitrilysin family protein [Methylococcales bacterium]